MLRKSKAFTLILVATIFLAGAEGIVSTTSTAAEQGVTTAVAEDAPTSNQFEYDDLYGLRVEVTQNPTNPYYRSGTPDYSGLELSVFTKGKDGKESETLSSASLDEVRNMYDVNTVESPGGGAFVVMVSAYSTALNRTVTANAEFYMEVIDSNDVTSIRSEIINLPNVNVMYADAGLDLTGLTLSVWETTNDGTETEVYTNADLETIRERYTVDVSYKASEYDGESICVITIYSFVGGNELKTSSEFTCTVGGLKPIYKGDVNADGDFNVSDVVMLQKWLLAVPDTHLANWKAADFCEDERLDVFDLCLMKRELINRTTQETSTTTTAETETTTTTITTSETTTTTTTYPVKNPEVIDEFTPCTATIDDEFAGYVVEVTIKKQCTTNPLRVWTISDFSSIQNIDSISDGTIPNSERQVIYITLINQSKENVLKLIHDIEDLNISEIYTVRPVSWD